MSREFKITLVLLCVIAVAVFAYIQFGPGITRQQRNMVIARQLLPRVEAIIDSNNRFRDITAFIYTGQDGAIGLSGTVNSDDDLFKLMKAIADERLPITISWQVKVVASSGQ